MNGNGKIPVLIVEDDLPTLRLLEQIVGHYFPQFSIDTASSPPAAFLLFDRHCHDILITDLRGPAKDNGLKIADYACDKKPDVIVFIITADPVHDLRGRNLCLADVLSKPVMVQPLLDKLSRAVEQLHPGEGGGIYENVPQM